MTVACECRDPTAFEKEIGSGTRLQLFPNSAMLAVDGEALIRAVISIGHSLRLPVVAEGVETASQLAKLREFGCDYFQGYLRGKPLPATAFEAVLANSDAMTTSSDSAVIPPLPSLPG